MANSKFTMTEIEALESAIKILQLSDGENVEAIIERLEHMVAARKNAKSRKSAKAIEEARQNAFLVNLMVDKIKKNGDAVSSSWIVENGGIDILTVQKATAIMRKAIDAGLVEKLRDNASGKVLYKAL